MITELSSYRRQIGCHHTRQLPPGNMNHNSVARNDENNARTVPSRCMPLLITGLLLTSQIAQALAAPPTVTRGQHGPPSRGAGALRTVRQTSAAHSASESYAPAAPALGVGHAPEPPVFPSRSDRDSVLAGHSHFSHSDEAQAPPARTAARKKRWDKVPDLAIVPGCDASGRLNLALPASQCRDVTASHCPARHLGEAVASPARLPFSLAQAAKEGDLDCVNACLRAGSVVDQLDENNYTPLQLAIKNGHLAVVETLLSHNASLAVVTQDRNATVLHLAAHAGCPEVLLLLADVDRGLVNQKDSCGWTPLMIATQWPDPTLCSILLNVTGINVNLTNRYHQSALWLATAHGNKKVFDRLLQCQDVDVNIADNYNNTALMEVVRKGKNCRLKQLLKNTSIDINRQDNRHQTALMLAIEHNKPRMFDSLLAAEGQDPSLPGWYGETALYMAVNLAVKSGNLSYVQKLMAKSTDEINATEYDGNTALHMAAYADKRAIVEQLLTAESINVMLKNRHGEDALHRATKSTETYWVLRNYMMQHQLGPIDDEVADEKSP
ncbi:ankyrin repeat family protein [Candidatus Sodalis pierantonius str. SOPE]|uniref:Ankyrin repeat family protein n=1 Tax=Candidatus Sodalis pierantonii str. SOPE TaxID=2342 RepID=W0HPT8_9GAMM|nr:ankyrin repeat domain-containing protein [Candidatus Sodalis pierantonius]AHF74492.1 ankyrin repeat family protein [Candidatus Sodalis pierantonius str. SOPE]